MARKSLVMKRGDRSQKLVAGKLGITTSYYGMIEQGVRNPSLELAKTIADYYEATIEELFFNNTNNNMLFVATE